MDGRSWKGAGGCFNIHGWGGASIALSLSAPPPLTTRTRRQCAWALTVRRSEGQIFIDTSGLRTSIHSDEIVSESTLRTELSRIITEKLSAEVAHEITGLGVTSTAGASLTAEQIRQAVETYVATHEFVLVHYVVTIEGTLTVRRDWTIREVWDWVGRDCAVSEPELIEYAMRGPDLDVNVRTQFDIWEMYAPRSDKARGREWAEGEARFQHESLLRRGGWLPELPLPPGFPPSPNVG
jgi:hypothetical protein